MQETPAEWIEQFFVKDGKTIEGYVRKSVLLQITRDLQFVLGIGKTGWFGLGLNNEQEVIKKQMLPLLTPVLLFCSAVDLLARVKLQRTTRSGENGEVFKGILTKYFSLTASEADVFWKFRCSLSHQYVISKNVVLHRAGSSKIIEKSQSSDFWIIYVHSMYTSLTRVCREICDEEQNRNETDQAVTANFLKEHGFIKQSIGAEQKQL